jgi:hypothetical protein
VHQVDRQAVHPFAICAVQQQRMERAGNRREVRERYAGA